MHPIAIRLHISHQVGDEGNWACQGTMGGLHWSAHYRRYRLLPVMATLAVARPLVEHVRDRKAQRIGDGAAQASVPPGLGGPS
jgi:hypothetical protein